MSHPRISVICIFYNAERFFAEAIDSVLAQDSGDFELLLVDDGSTDGGTAIALDRAARNPGRVRYLEHPSHANRGMSAARNLGLAHARGDLITFIDADDVWRPHKLREQVAILDAHPAVGMICGKVNYWSGWEGGEDRLVQTGPVADAVTSPPETSKLLYPLGTADAPCPSDVMIRREALESVGGFEQRSTGLYEDCACFSKIFLVTPVYFSSRVWLDYRQHADSCSSAVGDAGNYYAVRRDFLDWFAGYLARIDLPWKAEVERALMQARWRTSVPKRALDRLRREAAALTRAFSRD